MRTRALLFFCNDVIELYGTDGTWSFSEAPGTMSAINPLRRNTYVELDYMVGSGAGQNFTPYSGLPTDVLNVFRNDGSITAEVVIGNAIPYSQFMTLDSCPVGLPNCVRFNDLKTTHFSPTEPGPRRLYFHYGIFGAQYVNGNCSSGQAELLGNDFMVTLDGACNFTFSPAEQHGTFTHEFGHNLALTHNWNDALGGENSEVHNSVMNYRYQFTGVSGRTGAAAHTYSFGANGCAACATSPKWTCLFADAAGQCSMYPQCDCDSDEWNTWLRLDFYEGLEWMDGVDKFTRENPKAKNARGSSQKELQVLADDRVAPIEPVGRKRERAQKQVAKLEQRGMRKGTDYRVSEDGLNVLSICK